MIKDFNQKLEIIITYRIVLFFLILVLSWFFMAKALINTYDTWLAVGVWVLIIVSYILSIFLIYKE